MDCQNCKERKTADPVPYIVHESAMARNERTIKRLVIALIIAVALIFASNAAWIYVWQLYDYASEETVYTQDGEGVNIIGDRNTAGIYGTEYED
jgi:hypothetical protein